jgi:hypothetical protein
MPKLFDLLGCIIYFWSNEGFEPIHIHISEGKPTPNATKYWLYSDGTLHLAYNDKRIPSKKLNRIIERLEKCSRYIESAWITHFGDISYFDKTNQ